MPRILTMIIASLLIRIAACATTGQSLESNSLATLEHGLAEIDAERGQLVNLTVRSGVGSIGWQSGMHPDSNHLEWAKIELETETLIDQITLAPILWRDTNTGIAADGFPAAFRIIVGQEDGNSGTEVAALSSKDQILPRIAPLVIPIQPTLASWVRIEAYELSPRMSDGRYLFQLSEIMVFSGPENVALRRPVEVSSFILNRVIRSNRTNALVDGLTPYLLDAPNGKGSVALVAFYITGPQAALTIDLGENLPIDQIHLHAADVSENVPQVHYSDYGVPKHLVIEGSLQSDFSDAVPLVEFQRESIYDAGPILMWRFSRTRCRYLRVTALDGYKAPEAREQFRCVGFAEIEAFSQGRNVALGKPTYINIDMIGQDGSLEALTDGHNHFGKILPLRDWMEQLARRHDLERERPFLVAALNQRYEQQKTNLRLMSTLTILLAVGIGFTILIDRIIRLRQTERLKERFAADLHDELGADLHTIGLLSDLAQNSLNNPQKLNTHLQQIRKATEETGAAVRHFSSLQAELPSAALESAMRQTAQRIVVHLQHDLSIEGNRYLEQLRPSIRSDLFLFYKESLINICRHSGATQLETRLKADHRTIHLSISDNGHGLSESKVDSIPPSLQRRAKLLRAKIAVETPPSGGTKINLTLRLPWHHWIRERSLHR